MPSARDLLEQADALMRSNRNVGGARATEAVPVLTDIAAAGNSSRAPRDDEIPVLTNIVTEASPPMFDLTVPATAHRTIAGRFEVTRFGSGTMLPLSEMPPTPQIVETDSIVARRRRDAEMARPATITPDTTQMPKWLEVHLPGAGLKDPEDAPPRTAGATGRARREDKDVDAPQEAFEASRGRAVEATEVHAGDAQADAARADTARADAANADPAYTNAAQRDAAHADAAHAAPAHADDAQADHSAPGDAYDEQAGDAALHAVGESAAPEYPAPVDAGEPDANSAVAEHEGRDPLGWDGAEAVSAPSDGHASSAESPATDRRLDAAVAVAPVERSPTPPTSHATPEPRAVDLRELADTVYFQVLQNLDLYTERALQARLTTHLAPIIERASRELLSAINANLGALIRQYVADAIEKQLNVRPPSEHDPIR